MYTIKRVWNFTLFFDESSIIWLRVLSLKFSNYRALSYSRHFDPNSALVATLRQCYSLGSSTPPQILPRSRPPLYYQRWVRHRNFLIPNQFSLCNRRYHCRFHLQKRGLRHRWTVSRGIVFSILRLSWSAVVGVCLASSYWLAFDFLLSVFSLALLLVTDWKQQH